MKKFQFIKFLFLITLVITMLSCAKDDIEDSTQSTQITVKLKSSNQSASKVYLDIQGIQIRTNENAEATNAWLNLSTVNEGAFNISDFEEDTALLLVDNFEVESYYVYEIRLVLGDNNFMDINHVLHSLDLGNAKPSNLIETQLNSKRRYDMVIDIDLDKSVSYNEQENIIVFNPKLYTQIRQIEY